MSTLTNTAFWGECGASWLPTPYREKGPLMLSPCWVTSFLLLEPQKKKKSCGAYQNQSSKDLKLTFKQSDDAELYNRLNLSNFYTAAVSLILLQLRTAESLPSVQACISIPPKLAETSCSTLSFKHFPLIQCLKLTFNKILCGKMQKTGFRSVAYKVQLSKQSRNQEN